MPSSLHRMNESDFTNFLQNAIPAYARENVESGRWPEEGAIERSHADYRKFLPDGIHTKNNYLFKVLSPLRVPVGILWLATEELTHSAFIYDIEIDADYRRQGFATQQALNDADEFARSLGMKSIGLHVFQQNRAAQILYTSLGYKTVSVNMAKSLE